MRLTLPIWPLIVFASACASDPVTSRDETSSSVLVTSDRTGQFQTQLSLIGHGSAPMRSATVAGHLESALLLADSTTLLLGVVHADTRRELVAMEGQTLHERWRRPVSNRLVPAQAGEIGLRGVTALAQSIDQQGLYVSPAVRGEAVGLARINLQTNAAEAFSGPWQEAPEMVRVLPARPGLPEGAVLMVASRKNPTGGPPSDPATIHLLHPLTLAPLDSLTPATLGFPGAIIDLLPLDHGAILLVGTMTHMFRVGLHDHRVIASAPRPGHGFILPLAQGGTFALLDRGTSLSPVRSGLIYLLSPELIVMDSIDVSTPLGGTPHSVSAPAMGGGVFDTTTGELLVWTGSVPGIFSGPPLPARAIVVHIGERRVVRMVPLSSDGFGLAFRLRAF